MLSKAIGEGLSLKAAENVWWSMVIPVLNYGAEIWGATKFLEAEKLQVEAGRKLLRVSRKMLSVESLAGGQCEPKGASNV